jgi:hypothetical protein
METSSPARLALRGTARAANELAELLADRLVQQAGKRAIQVVDRDQFNEIGEILVRAAQIAQGEKVSGTK